MKYIYFQRIRLLKNKIAAELRYILNLNEYIVMEYYSVSCINYCSFVNIYKCFIPKERIMF